MYRSGTALTEAIAPAAPLPGFRMGRLAELVMHLSSCAPEVALHAMARSAHTPPTDGDEALVVVARALVSVRHGVDLRDEHVALDEAAS
jgi:hypothetical protein